MTRRIFDDAKLTDHHAIIPTGKKANLDALTPEEAKLFDLIARRVVAAFYPPYVYNAIRVVTESEGERFLSNGVAVLQEGFKAVYRDHQPKRKDKKEEEAQLPPLRKGEERTVAKTQVKSDQTKPPKEHTDASLLSEMEHAGRQFEDEELREQMRGCSLGTPATRAAIIERLIAVGYARRKGRQILATPKGVRLIEAVPPDIASPETTGKWELALEKIARGTGDESRFLDGIRRLAAFLVEYAANQAPPVPFEAEQRRTKGKKRSSKQMELPCPLCGRGKITENSKAFGCSRWREGCSFTLWKNAVVGAGGPELNAKIVRALLNASDGSVRGSTGTLRYQNGRVTFQRKGE